MATERDIAAQMLADVAEPGRRATLGADKAQDTAGLARACRQIHVTPHIAQNLNHNAGNAINRRTTRHTGYQVSQRHRTRIEQSFGLAKVIGPMRKVLVQGLGKVDQLLTLTMATCNLTQLRILVNLPMQCA